MYVHIFQLKVRFNRKTPKYSKLYNMFWTIYFWGLFAFNATGFIDKKFSGQLFVIWDWFDLVLTTVAIIGLFLYTYREKIGPAMFWKIFAISFIGWDLFINCVIREFQKDIWIFFLILTPMYLGLIIYGFKFHKETAVKV